MTEPRAESAASGPPHPSRGLLYDVRWYLFHRPDLPTRIDTATPERREEYEHRIRQRIDVSVEDYAVLNIHRIGIDAPVGFVFDELMAGRAVPTCWPDHLAHAEFLDRQATEVRIRLLGIRFLPLFRMRAVRTQRAPGTHDMDNARYVIYECSGGYPVGMFAMYVRRRIDALEESGETQFFLAVGFNFFGRRRWSGRNPVYRVWEGVHDRATANILNRFKRLCEWHFSRSRDAQPVEGGQRR